MAIITSITAHCDASSMGDCTEQAAVGYRDWLTAELQRGYPEAAVRVVGGPSVHTVETDHDDTPAGDAAHERVELFVRQAWDRCPWTWVEV